MGLQNRQVLKKILNDWIYGTVAVTAWLKEKGAYRQLLNKYEKNNWLKKIGTGAYIRPNDEVMWTGGLYAIQYQSNLNVHVGAKTALEFQGYAHNIVMGKGRHVTILSDGAKKLPKWFMNMSWDVNICFRILNVFSNMSNVAISNKQIENYKINISEPERALIELMALTPTVYSFEEVVHILEGVMSPRIKLLQSLLESCTSNKAKRLFFYLSEYCNMPWVSKLEKDKIEFGKGVHSFCSNGKYISDYKITVPKEFVPIEIENML